MVRRRTKILGALLAPLLLFGGLEAALRIGGFEYRPDLVAAREEVRRLPPEWHARDPDLLWRLPASTRIDFPEAGYPGVVTNSLGLRGPEPPGVRLPGDLRVLCLGDSITFGIGLRDGEEYPAELARLLRAAPALAGRSVHVLNGGVPGFTSVQGMALLDRLGWYEPDVVVFWFGMNDAHRAWGLPDSGKLGRSAATRNLVTNLYRLRVVQLAGRTADSLGGRGEFGTRASIEEFREAVARLSAAEAAGGPAAIFVNGPTLLGRTGEQLARVVARAEAEGVDRVAGPVSLIVSVAPAPDDLAIEGRVADGPDGPELVFGDRPDLRASLERVREGLDEVRLLAAGMKARAALLPEGTLGPEALFGGEPADRVLRDNCHLNPRGARLAARAIADAVLARRPRAR